MSMLKENIRYLNKESIISSIVEDNIDDALTLYRVSRAYNLRKAAETSLRRIERRFPTLQTSRNFLHLDFASARMILSSGELNVDSELQVFSAAVRWLAHCESRSQSATDILSKIRLALLTPAALRSCKESSFGACIETLSKLPSNKGNVTKVRRCSQKNFDLVFCGGMNRRTFQASNSVRVVRVGEPRKAKTTAAGSVDRMGAAMVVVGGRMYMFGGFRVTDMSVVATVDRYDVAIKRWEKVAAMRDARVRFSSCSFMRDDVYVIGGRIKGGAADSNCSVFNVNALDWREAASMLEERASPASSAFRGLVVVTGGFSGANDGNVRTAEAYDHVGDEWTRMPDMVVARSGHGQVAVGSKLFVVGGEFEKSCECFCSNRFSIFAPPNFRRVNLAFLNRVVAFGRGKLAVFKEFMGDVLYYDVINDAWSAETCQAL